MAGPIGSTSPRSSQLPVLDEATPAAPSFTLLSSARFRIDSPEPFQEDADEDSAGSHASEGSPPRLHTDERIMSAPPELGPPRQAASSVDVYPGSNPQTLIAITDVLANDPGAPSSYDPIASPVPYRAYAETALEGIAEDNKGPSETADEGSPPPEAKVLGKPFKVDWVRTDRLPFLRTRHLRNPWNHGRQVKVSRDGTEVEPDVARQLLEEWDRPPPPSPPAKKPPSRTKPNSSSQRRRSKASADVTIASPSPSISLPQ